MSLQVKRAEVLETRELNRARGEAMCAKTEDECNAALRKLNLAIQGVAPYEEEKPVEPAKPKRQPRRKKAEPVDEPVQGDLLS